jgi:hypothetical protein
MLWALVGVLSWRGRSRVLAAVPFAAVLVYSAVVLVPDVLEDPSSHNLLPFELGIWFWPSLPYMAVIAATRPKTLGPED